MNKSIVALCIILLMVNSYFIFISPDTELGRLIGNEKDDEEITEEFNVTVPALHHGDIANYHDVIFGEMYWINYTSGNWTKITLSMVGPLIKIVLNVETHEDGFGIMHQVVPYSELAPDVKVTLRYEEGNTYDESAGEDITINGGAVISRLDYRDLDGKKIIKSVTDGEVTIDQTLQKFKELEFTGKLRSYPNPNEPVEETLDEIIYRDSKIISTNDTGKIEKKIIEDESKEGAFYNTVYHWKADKTEKIGIYTALRININATFGNTDFSLPFLRQIWIANDISQPVKIYTRTNQSWKDEDGEAYFILENTQTMNGYTRGETSISWGSCNAEAHYYQQNPSGEYLDWDYMPADGSKFEDSSFDFGPDEAIELALRESDELKDFLNEHNNDVIMDFAQYNSTKDPKEITQTASNRWLFVFGYKLSPEEWEYYRENDETPKKRYALVVTYNQTTLGIADIKEVENDYGRLNWSTGISKDELSDELLTLTSAEEILKSDSEVKENIYTNTLNPEKIYWDDPRGKTQMYLGQGITQESLPSIPVIETLTGFTIPTSKYSWIVQKGQLFAPSETGSQSTFGAAVDAETGQMQYVLKVTGTSLYGLFD